MGRKLRNEKRGESKERGREEKRREEDKERDEIFKEGSCVCDVRTDFFLSCPIEQMSRRQKLSPNFKSCDLLVPSLQLAAAKRPNKTNMTRER